jgi:hypothetical protein
MSYLHIDNLYKCQDILMFREAYALEKIHGTSAHVRWKVGEGIGFFAGGEKHENFVALFDAGLEQKMAALGAESVVVNGEAYGGKQQGQSWRYGKVLKFVAFDARINGMWLDVPNAADLVSGLGLEFVHYARMPAELAAIDAQRDAPSEQARRNGVEGEHPREGVVLRPVKEMLRPDGARVMAKHKRDEERETASPRKVVDPGALKVLEDARAIADEWVTPTRMAHVLDQMPGAGMEQTRDVIRAMIDDVVREGAGEILDSKEARSAIGKRAAGMFRALVKGRLYDSGKEKA